MFYTTRKTIRFSHCDPAGIVFYPRYAELCNEVVEDWFAEALGIDFRRYHEEMGLGLPAVRLELEFLAPSRLGEVLEFRLAVRDIGNSSLTLAISALKDGQTRVRIRLKTVMISLRTMKSLPIDDAWRERFAAYLESPLPIAATRPETEP